MDPRLLTLLRCRVTGKALTLTPRNELAAINDVRLKAGLPAWQAALRTDEPAYYPIDDGIPVMLTEARWLPPTP